MKAIDSIENKDRPLFSLTVGEFEELLQKHLSPMAVQATENESCLHLLKGIQELADFLGISLSTAQRLKATGVLIPATMQTGRTCLFDSAKVLEVMQSRSAVIHYKKKKSRNQ